jgi:hypothetical protein
LDLIVNRRGGIPLDYWNAYTHKLESEVNDNRNMLEFRTKMGLFDGSTQADWAILEPLLAGIPALYREVHYPEIGESSTYGLVSRVEFFSVHVNNYPTKRGAVLFDNRGEPLLHAFNALLGYGGSGPHFSRQILSAIGVPDQMFSDANKMVVSGEYDSLIFSRERHETVEGIDTVFLGADVMGDWNWWISS